MNSIRVWSLFAAGFLAACSSEGYTPFLARPYAYARSDEAYDRFTLQRTACFGVCPIYKVIVDERDVLFFEGERFVTEADGVISKRLPEGSFDELVKIARAHEFSAYDPRYPNADGDNCAGMVTDMPSVIVSFDAKRLQHDVSFYEGCRFDGRERFEAMVAAMDAVLDVDDWVGSAGDEE